MKKSYTFVTGNFYVPIVELVIEINFEIKKKNLDNSMV